MIEWLVSYWRLQIFHVLADVRVGGKLGSISYDKMATLYTEVLVASYKIILLIM